MNLCRLAFPCFVGVYLRTSVILHGSLSLRNPSQPTTTTTGFEILLHVVLYLATSWYISQEKWFGFEFACFVRLSIVFFNVNLSFFMSFGHQKAKKFWGALSPDPPLGLYHGLAWGLTINSRPPATFCIMCVSCSHNLSIFDTTNVDLLFCINPWQQKHKSKMTRPEYRP